MIVAKAHTILGLRVSFIGLVLQQEKVIFDLPSELSLDLSGPGLYADSIVNLIDLIHYLVIFGR